jgi:CBS domain-containing protein
MRIAEICTRSVVTCGRETSALTIAQRMRESHVGDVIVVDVQDGMMSPVGVVTDRDLVIEVVAKGLDPASVRAGDLLAADAVMAIDSENIYDAVWHMRGKGIRRLPVIDAQGHLVGVLTADDVTRALAEELTELTRIAPDQVRREQARAQPTRRPNPP